MTGAAAMFDVESLEKRRNSNVILLDIIITKNNKELRALRPVYDSHNPIPLTNNKNERDNWFKTAHPDRLNKRIMGNLKGRSLTRAKHLVNAALGMLPADSIKILKDIELGSLHLFEEDFIKE